MSPYIDDNLPARSGLETEYPKGFADFDVDEILEELTTEEKVSLLAGKDFWHTNDVPRLKIPSLRLSDGPNGIRGTRFFGSVPSSCLPCATAIGATFDKDLALRIGHLLADEARAKGAHVVLGPTINIQRGPLGGRGFESFSEDPLLSGTMAGFYCKGLKDKNIVATPKHFVCNDQEHERMAVNSIVTERALREIYLLPFMIAIKMAQPGAIMTAYNKVNGVHVSESQRILQNILRDEWKWDGLVMSDWFGTYSTSGSIKAGLDLEMPGPSRWRGPALVHAVSSNKVRQSVLNARVRAVLELVKLARKSGIPENAPEKELDRPEDRALLREVAANAVVLLKNEDNVLPLKKDKRIAVIGPNAKIATYCGGGSASLNAYRAVTPFDGVKAQAQDSMEFAQGAYGHQMLPPLGKELRTADGRQGFTLRFFNEPHTSADRKLLEERHLTDANMFFIDYSHPDLAPIWYAEAEGTFVPTESGTYDFGVCVQGTGTLSIDGKVLVRNVENQRLGSSFLGCGTLEETASKALQAGQAYNIKVQWGCAKTSKLKTAGAVDFGHGGLRFSGCRRLEDGAAVAEAVRLAASVDQVVLFAGLSGEWESEGEDRTTMDLPPGTDDLILKVLDANPNTVVVVQSGTPVAMPWADRAKAILHAWYGGNETGNGIADVLYGDVNPSAKLSLTFPKRLKDNPSYLNYRSEGGRVLYGEDVYVGYRFFEEMEIAPLFPFGHGLSYTTFALSDLRVSQDPTSTQCDVRVRLHNSGDRAGAEVMQVYVAPVSPPLKRPVKELKDFAKRHLSAGEVAEVSVCLDLVRATSFWEEKEGKWCSHAGDYKIMVGTSSAGRFLESTVAVRKTTYWSGL
ncbi:hypothetical protein LTR85_009198 [Meristemomyces frigidus]|nr:hypothetical protein LTR85_009198 [Meristemomyces frigidus]